MQNPQHLMQGKQAFLQQASQLQSPLQLQFLKQPHVKHVIQGEQAFLQHSPQLKSHLQSHVQHLIQGPHTSWQQGPFYLTNPIELPSGLTFTGKKAVHSPSKKHLVSLSISTDSEFIFCSVTSLYDPKYELLT